MTGELRVHFNEEPDESLSLTKDFHRVIRMLPSDQELLTVPHDMKTGDALKLMSDRGYSQVPVEVNGNLIGVFSHRSFAEGIAKLGSGLLNNQQTPCDMEVEEFAEAPNYARLDSDIQECFRTIAQKDCLIVGESDSLRGILTPIDIFTYLYDVARPFVLIAEIELCVRALIRAATTEEQLRECCDRVLKHYDDAKRPYCTENMTFSDYGTLIGDGRHWEPYFKSVFRGDRKRTKANLDEIARLRNDIFHFRSGCSWEQYQTLVEHREWIFRKARTAEQIQKGGQ